MKNPVKIYHVKNEINGGVVTIATKVNSADMSVGFRSMSVGFCFCSPKDVFVRKFGTKVATARMNMPTRKNSYTTHFSGHSATDLVYLWNHIEKPAEWMKSKLLNIPEIGLTFVEKV
jgi:hypothetical protein